MFFLQKQVYLTCFFADTVEMKLFRFLWFSRFVIRNTKSWNLFNPKRSSVCPESLKTLKRNLKIWSLKEGKKNVFFFVWGGSVSVGCFLLGQWGVVQWRRELRGGNQFQTLMLLFLPSKALWTDDPPGISLVQLIQRRVWHFEWSCLCFCLWSTCGPASDRGQSKKQKRQRFQRYWQKWN